MNVLSIDELFDMISANAGAATTTALLKTCKQLNDKITRSIDSAADYQLINYLRSKVWNIDELIKCLKICGGVITGSILLQYYYSEYWDNNIEIFCIDNKLAALEIGEGMQCPICQLLLKNGYARWVNWTSDLNDFYRYELLPFHTIKFKHPQFDYIINITYFDSKKCSRRGLYLSTMQDYIDYFLDLECCKIIYNGERIYVKDIYGINLKRTAINFDWLTYVKGRGHIIDKKTVQRLNRICDNYSNHGFDITNRKNVSIIFQHKSAVTEE